MHRTPTLWSVAYKAGWWFTSPLGSTFAKAASATQAAVKCNTTCLLEGDDLSTVKHGALMADASMPEAEHQVCGCEGSGTSTSVRLPRRLGGYVCRCLSAIL